jgi:hypothetical protein
LRMTPTLRTLRSKSEDFCAGQNLWEGQPVQWQDQRDRKEISACHPLNRRKTTAELLSEFRQGHVDDCRVELGQQHA